MGRGENPLAVEQCGPAEGRGGPLAEDPRLPGVLVHVGHRPAHDADPPIHTTALYKGGNMKNEIEIFGDELSLFVSLAAMSRWPVGRHSWLRFGRGCLRGRHGRDHGCPAGNRALESGAGPARLRAKPHDQDWIVCLVTREGKKRKREYERCERYRNSFTLTFNLDT